MRASARGLAPTPSNTFHADLSECSGTLSTLTGMLSKLFGTVSECSGTLAKCSGIVATSRRIGVQVGAEYAMGRA